MSSSPRIVDSCGERVSLSPGDLAPEAFLLGRSNVSGSLLGNFASTDPIFPVESAPVLLVSSGGSLLLVLGYGDFSGLGGGRTGVISTPWMEMFRIENSPSTLVLLDYCRVTGLGRGF